MDKSQYLPASWLLIAAPIEPRITNDEIVTIPIGLSITPIKKLSSGSFRTTKYNITGLVICSPEPDFASI